MAYNINVSPWMTGSASMAEAIKDQGEAEVAKIKSRNKGLETAAGLLLTAGAGGMLGGGIGSVLNSGGTGALTSSLIGGLTGTDPAKDAAQGLSSFIGNNATENEDIVDANGNKLGKKGGYGGFGSVLGA